jgi:hypothetical protein
MSDGEKKRPTDDLIRVCLSVSRGWHLHVLLDSACLQIEVDDANALLTSVLLIALVAP